MLNVSSPPRVLKPGDYSAAQVADFGLDPPHLLVSVVANTGKTSSVTFGEPTPAQNAQYVRVIGQPDLYLMPRYVGVEWELAVDMAQRLLPAGVRHERHATAEHAAAADVDGDDSDGRDRRERRAHPLRARPGG